MRTVDAGRLAEQLAQAKVFDLTQPLVQGMPQSPNHPPFRMALQRRHGDWSRPDGGSSASEMIVTGGHVGTHIDALCHVSHQGRLFGGIEAAAALEGGRFALYGVETVAPVVGRGVLLDVAAARGKDSLGGGEAISGAELADCAEAAGVEVEESDVVLVRTGWASHWGDAEACVGHDTGVPGLDESAARWLAERRPRVVGGDTIALEVIAPGLGHRELPVHRILLVESGIHIVETMRLDELAGAGVAAFAVLIAPLPIVGATGSPVRALALV